MPELPEVEVTRISLAHRLLHARVLEVRLGKPLRWPLGLSPAQLSGLVVGELLRRGKYLWMPLALPPAAALIPAQETARHGLPEADAALPLAPGGLLLHLGMSGSLGLSLDPPLAGLHDHFEMRTTHGTLRLTDPRRFGAVVWSPALHAAPAAGLLARLGAEPFDPAFDALQFHAALQRRRTPIKTALLAGDIVVGAGNIYASEALFRAGIDPRLRADRLSRPRAARLLACVRQTLSWAIALGGSTLRDFRDAHGMSGAFQSQAAVYGRDGQPCVACGQPIRRIVQAQRATYFCSHCQRR